MEIRKSDIVRAVAGRDKSKLFMVVNADEQYAYIANGKSRKLEAPKHKKLKHLSFVSKNNTETGEKLRLGEEITNSEIRRTLAEFTADDGE